VDFLMGLMQRRLSRTLVRAMIDHLSGILQETEKGRIRQPTKRRMNNQLSIIRRDRCNERQKSVPYFRHGTIWKL